MSRLKRVVLFQIAGGLGLVAAFVLLSRLLPLADYIGAAQRYVTSLGAWGGVLYPLLYAACNILLLPGGTLAIGSGLFFGLWWGFLSNVVAGVISAAVSFGLARFALRGWVRERLLRQPKWVALDAALGREGWKVVFLSQLHPLAPSSLLSYLYGVTRIRFRTALLWVAIGQAPGAFLYAYLGTLAQLGLRLWRGVSHPRPEEYVLWLGGLALTFVITALLGRMALRLLAEAEAKASSEAPPPPAQVPRVEGSELLYFAPNKSR